MFKNMIGKSFIQLLLYVHERKEIGHMVICLCLFLHHIMTACKIAIKYTVTSNFFAICVEHACWCAYEHFRALHINNIYFIDFVKTRVIGVPKTLYEQKICIMFDILHIINYTIIMYGM